MPRKWTILGLTMAVVTALATGFAMAQDEDSPLHKLMENVQKKNAAIMKGVRTPVAFKKSQKEVVDSANELAKLAKEAREFKEPSEKQKKAFDVWTKHSDDMAKACAEFAKVAGEDGVTQATAKGAYKKVSVTCAACHKDFRVDE